MRSLLKYLFIIPITFLTFELVYFAYITSSHKITPYSANNQYLEQLTHTLRLSGIKYQQLSFFDHRQEAELLVTNDGHRAFKVIISTASSPLYQVTALQKLIKIANIEGRELSFVDLSSRRPYATF